MCFGLWAEEQNSPGLSTTIPKYDEQSAVSDTKGDINSH